MEVLLGVTGPDFVLVASNKTAVRGVTIFKHSDEKTRVLNEHTLMLFSGESGDTTQFAEFIQANVRLEGLRHNSELSPVAVASYTRQEIAKALRSRKPYQVNLLMAGYNKQKSAPVLYFLDYLATMAPVPYTAHGYGAYYCSSIFDRYHRKDITFDQGIELLQRCFAELQKRMPINLGDWSVKVVDQDGIREVEAAKFKN